MSLLWVDATRGAAGDMLLAALWDAGASEDRIRDAVRRLAPVDVEFRHELRDGLRVARARVLPDVSDSSSRRWQEVQDLLGHAHLTDGVRQRALRTFTALAEAEAAVHATSVADVHFHEVGAADAIADVVGVAAALEDLGVRRVVASTVAVGSAAGSTTEPLTPDATARPPTSPGSSPQASGTLATRGRHEGAIAPADRESPTHPLLPTPPPAVLALAAAHRVPVAAGDLPGEVCTPTGMALLATLTDAWSVLPPVRLSTVGVGAGSRPTPGRFGALRVLLGESEGPAPASAGDVALVTETNVDDLDPRLWPRVLARLMHIGADDAWLTPILMKKGRPAHTLRVLSSPELARAVRDVVVTETTAIGVRVHAVAKHALSRETATVDAAGTTIRVKVARLEGAVVNVQPEWEDVATAAAATGRAAKDVLAEASARARALHPGTRAARPHPEEDT